LDLSGAHIDAYKAEFLFNKIGNLALRREKYYSVKHINSSA